MQKDMSTIDIKDVFIGTKFIERYRMVCESFNDFENSIRGSNKDKYLEILESVNLTSKFNKGERFYRHVDKVNDLEVTLTLSLHDGLVEPLIAFELDNNTFLTPDGRWDFIPEKLGVKFDRKKHNLPKFKNIDELRTILKEISSIYYDILRQLENKFK
jgi:hypothetical protein